LGRDRFVPIPSTPPVNFNDGSAESGPHRLSPDYPSTPPRLAPEVGEAQEIEGLGSLIPSRGLAPRASEFQQSGLLGMEAQTEPRKTVCQHGLDSPSINLVLEQDDEVIRVTDQETPTAQTRLDIPNPPRIEHIVQIDVRKQRRDYPTLRSATAGTFDNATVQDTCPQPLADESFHYPVAHPAAKQRATYIVVDSVEEARNIDIEYPAAPEPHRRPTQGCQRVVR
jgi:hypothetical protein